jgi:hypothetical protein
MSGMVHIAPPTIKSIQRGVAALPSVTTGVLDVTISSVDISKSFVSLGGFTGVLPPEGNYFGCRLRLTSATNLEFNDYNGPYSVNWEVIEFN